MDTKKNLFAAMIAALMAASAAHAQSAQTDPASPAMSGTQQNIGNSQGNASQTGSNAAQDAGTTRSLQQDSSGTAAEAHPHGTGDFNISPSSNLQGPVGEGEATQWWPGKDSESETRVPSDSAR